MKFKVLFTVTFLLIIISILIHFYPAFAFKKIIQNILQTKTFTNKFGMSFVLIPAGSFMMGSPENEHERDYDEAQHKVTLSQNFFMQTTELTQGQWKAVMGNNPSKFKNCGDDCPVETVSWNDVQIFIEKLNNMDSGRRYRLPTEAEWEYAARAGTTTRFFWGDQSDCSQANYGNDGIDIECKSINPGKTVAVKSYPSNSFGLYDMHGNVLEWCNDWLRSYQLTPVLDPKGPNSGSLRVNRGGGWHYNAKYCRSASRNGRIPGRMSRGDNLGFRLCASNQ